MRLFRMGMIWGVVYVVTLIPFALFFLLQFVSEVLFGGSWSPLLSADNLQTFDVLLFPFFITLFVAAIVLHRRDRNAAPPRRPLFGVPLPAWVVVCVVALTVLAASRDATVDMPGWQKRDLAATGCLNFMREGSIPSGAAKYYVAVYDRICDRAPKHTVNVSVLDSVGIMPVGPGNALVVEATDSSYESARKLMVFAHVPPSRVELQIVYDAPARVLSHNSSVHGLTVSIEADSSRNGIRRIQSR